jgi:hypothetical protein
MRGPIAVVAVTAAAVIAAIVVGLTTAGLHRTGGNMLPTNAFVATVPPGERLCQESEIVPPQSASVELSVGTYGRPGPPLEVSVGDSSTGRRNGGYGDGWVRVPYSGPAAARDEAQAVPRVCVRNAGDRRVALAGKASHPVEAARVGDTPAAGRVALRWRAAKPSTWWDDGAEVARRVTRGKADLGLWTPLVLLGVVWVGAFALVLRSVRP